MSYGWIFVGKHCILFFAWAYAKWKKERESEVEWKSMWRNTVIWNVFFPHSLSCFHCVRMIFFFLIFRSSQKKPIQTNKQLIIYISYFAPLALFDLCLFTWIVFVSLYFFFFQLSITVSYNKFRYFNTNPNSKHATLQQEPNYRFPNKDAAEPYVNNSFDSLSFDAIYMYRLYMYIFICIVKITIYFATKKTLHLFFLCGNNKKKKKNKPKRSFAVRKKSKQNKTHERTIWADARTSNSMLFF